MPPQESAVRRWIARAFSLTEDCVYIGLGVLLAVSAVTLLIVTAVGFASNLFSGDLTARIVPLLDRILLILLVVELLYTVQVSFREHAVTPEPFLLVGLIAAIRRVLVLTAEFGEASEQETTQLIVELGVLSILLLSIALSLYVLRRRETSASQAEAKKTLSKP